mgnify:CR=1 FL=1|tara:strand:+ start:13577 stop:14437 length:861 start_codon:yes stop_codon:yes gene_type:complete
MFKNISLFFYKFLKILDFIISKIFRRSFLFWFREFMQEDAYKRLKILDKKINFFVPNKLIDYRINSFFYKEPETLSWIDNFNTNKKIIFWDIGSNIGLYSIYAALRVKNIEIYAFEPSTSNLRILSRNISINNLQEKIFINQFPLSIEEKGYGLMMESNFEEGGALHSYGLKKNFEGDELSYINNYKIYGFNINYLVNHLNMEIPNYIKIDVDGLEHLILEGGSDILSDLKIEGMLIEINENYKIQFDKVKSLMEKNNFKIVKKEQSKYIKLSPKFDKSFNYIFSR